ncbi:hypothetical protein [Pseudomonas vancouverensis]|uniref:Uncharacterized protein n=1 Tax=Pseudomonas vancouverensis TaxID=95300 RepID=A0A1H2MXA8_PSEVA|nr:hypothetical protein [Pseudomonas vancouverensis]KAB0489674.1 hypothetical protein F7R09_28560 [Pseudomonas vancouverensis]TDB67170.1 hypothetical protein EIY72_03730 [Pseudomonas vancouverensis]SDU97186.1 hypothetical protein SAMN05216558_1330 [Pseudomonas vancouverensis]
MSGIERIIEALTAPPPPAAEVITLDRNSVERALILLESHPDIAQGGPSLCQEVCVFRQVLAEPKVELWAIHSVGPGEEYPCLNKEDAEQRAHELRDMGERIKQERIAQGESVEHWHDWVTNVIPSPWEPAEHFEIMAYELAEDADQIRLALKKLENQREKLVSALEFAIERWTLLANEFKYTTPEHERELAEISKARAAIAKATE